MRGTAIPTGPEGAREYKKVLRYSQGIIFKFSGKGFVYRIDWAYLIGVLTEAIVLLNVAAVITGAIATGVWPSRKVLGMSARLACLACACVLHVHVHVQRARLTLSHMHMHMRRPR